MTKKQRKKRESKLHRSHLNSFRKSNKITDLVPQNTKFVYEPAGQIKLSDAIEEIAAPFMHGLDTQEQHEKLIGLAVMAWNATLMPPEKEWELLNPIRDLEKDPERQVVLMELMKTLMARKRALYPEVKRPIFDYKVTDLGHAFHLSIISGLVPEEGSS